MRQSQSSTNQDKVSEAIGRRRQLTIQKLDEMKQVILRVPNNAELNINLIERLKNGNFVAITKSGHDIKQPQIILLFDSEGELLHDYQLITQHIATLSHYNNMIVVNPEPDSARRATITILDGRDLTLKHHFNELLDSRYRHVCATRDYIYCFHYDVNVPVTVHAYDWSLVPVTPSGQSHDFKFELPEGHFPFMITVSDDAYLVQTQQDGKGKVDVIDKETGECRAILDIPTPTSGFMHLTSRNEILMLSKREGQLRVYDCEGECISEHDLGQKVGEIDWRLSIDDQDRITIFEIDVFHFPTNVKKADQEHIVKAYINETD